MHDLASHSLESKVSHKFFFSIKGQPVSKVAQRPHPKPTHIYGTRANIKKKMDFLKQENQALKEGMATMQAKIDEMAAMQIQVDEFSELVRTLRAAPTTTTSFSCQNSSRSKWLCYPWLDDMFQVSNILCASTICALVHAPHCW